MTPLAISIPAPAILYPLAVWAVMAVLAVSNGIFRELVVIPRIGEYPGHVLSTALLVTAILAVSGAFFATTGIEYSQAALLAIGAGWTVLTVGFEFLVGHLEGTPVSETLAQYDVFAGQVWILVPLALFCSPLVFGWLLRS